MKSIVLIVALAAGCGDAAAPGLDLGMSDLAGTVASNGALIGTWDVTQTAVGRTTPTTYTVTVTNGGVVVNYGGTTVTLAPDGTGTKLTWNTSVITSTRSGGGNAGDLPINPIGDWIFTYAGNGSLTASVTASGLTTTCTGCGNSFVGSGFKGNLTGTKSAPASGTSIFGDLAGMWQIADQGGAKFTAALIGSALQFSFTPSGATSASFSLTATLSGNMISGSSSGAAYEFSARRR